MYQKAVYWTGSLNIRTIYYGKRKNTQKNQNLSFFNFLPNFTIFYLYFFIIFYVNLRKKR